MKGGLATFSELHIHSFLELLRGAVPGLLTHALLALSFPFWHLFNTIMDFPPGFVFLFFWRIHVVLEVCIRPFRDPGTPRFRKPTRTILNSLSCTKSPFRAWRQLHPPPPPKGCVGPPLLRVPLRRIVEVHPKSPGTRRINYFFNPSRNFLAVSSV